MSIEEQDMSPEILAARERIKQARAELDKGDDTNRVQTPQAEFVQSSEEVPATTTSTVAPKVEVKSDDELAKLRAQVSDLSKELSRRSGEYGSELDRLRKSFQLVNDENELLKNTANKKKNKEDKKPKEDWEVRRIKYFKDLTPEEKEAYEDDSLSIMAKISERTTKEIIKERLPEYLKEYQESSAQLAELPKIREKVEKLESATANMEFADVVDRMAPGFKVANGDESKNIPADEGWVSFLESKHDDFMTWREYCSTVGGPKVAAYAFRQYQSSVSKKNEPVVNEVAGQVSPQKSTAAVPVSDKSSRVLTMKEYEKFMEDVRRGAFDDDREEAVRIMAEYKKAVLEGRLQ